MNEHQPSTTTGLYAPPLPDWPTMLQAWNEVQTQAGEQTTAVAREALLAGMHWLEQNAANTRQWLAAASGDAERIAGLTHEALGKAGQARDLPTLLETEWALINETLGLTAHSAQQWLSAINDQQARLAQACWTQSNQQAGRLLRVLGSDGGVRLDPVAETPVISGDGPASPLEWMTAATQAAQQATQALWQAAAGAGTAAAQTRMQAKREAAGSDTRRMRRTKTA